MQIPNRYFIGFIKEDGHYKLPGITLLPRQRAARYHSLNFGDRYSVGYYRKLDYYLRHLERQALSPAVINRGVGAFTPQQLDDMFRQALRVLQSFEGKRIEPALAEEIRAKAAKIYEIFTHEVQAYEVLSGQNPEQSMKLAERIQCRYGLDFWKIVAFKQRAIAQSAG